MEGFKMIIDPVTLAIEHRVHKAKTMLSPSTIRGDLSHSTITRKNAIKLGVNVEKML